MISLLPGTGYTFDTTRPPATGTIENDDYVIEGSVNIDADSTSSAAKGMFTPMGDTVQRETTDDEFLFTKYYVKQYDGPTSFKGDYTVNLKADGSFEPTGSTIKFTTTTYTSRSYVTRNSADISAEEEAAMVAAGKTVYREGDNAYIFTRPRLKDSGWQTLSIPITEATLVDGKLQSFKFNGDWYGSPPAGLVDKGIAGEVDLKEWKASFTAKYQDPVRGAIATFVTTGKIEN